MKNTKKIGLVAAISLVVGNMIGSGIFMLPASLAAIGSISLVSWVFTGLGCLSIALVFARLSRVIPQSGGAYTYTRTILGDYLGFQTAYGYWIAMWTGNAAVALATTGYLSVFFPWISHGWNNFIATNIILWSLTCINILGVRKAGAFQTVITVLKLIPIFFVGILGFFFIHKENFTHFVNISHPHVSPFVAISTAATLTFWAFIGVESATLPAENIENPEKTIPRATIIGALFSTITYIIVSAVIMGMIPSPTLALSEAPFADAARIIVGPVGSYVVAIAAAISCIGALNGWILVTGYIPLAAARDKLFPQIFAKTNKDNTPVFSLIVSSCAMTVILLLTISNSLIEQFNTIILIAIVSSIIPYLYTAVADLLHLHNTNEPKHKKILHTIVAVFACVFSFWAIYSAGFKTVYLGSILLVTSVPLYAFVLNKKKDKKEQNS